MIFSMTGVFASDTSENVAEYKNETDKINFFYSLGVFDFEFFVDDPITRKEFAIILTRLLKHENYLDSYKGTYYTDVEADSYGELHINFMKNMGIMTGKTQTEFYPDDNLTLSEASSALIRMFGYHDRANAKGGWSVGVNLTASDLGLLKGVKSELSTEYLSAGAMAVMLFNAMNVEFVGNYSVEGTDTIISGGDSVTLLDDYWQIVKAEGLFNASGNVNLLGKSDFILEEGQIEINKKLYYVSNELYHENLGLNVEYYYYNDNSVRIPEIIFMAVKNNGHKIRIYSNERPILNAGAIEITKDDKTTRYKLSGKAMILYNGASVVEMKNEYVPTNGYIDLISNDGSNSYNVVMAYDFKTFRVRSKIEDKLVFDYNQKFNSQPSIELEANGLKPQIIKDGNNIEISEIAAGNIVSVCYNENTGYLVYVSSEKVNGYIDSMEDSPYSIYISNQKYYISPQFKTLVDAGADGTSAIEVGKMYNFTLDFMGNIYGMDDITSDMFFGYLMGVRKDSGLSDNVEVRIYSNFSSGFTVYPIAKKCTLDGASSDKATIYTKLDTFLAASSSANPPVVKYHINANSEVDKITIKTVAKHDPSQISDDVIVRSRTADPINGANKTVWVNSYGYFTNDLGNTDGNIFIDTDTPFMLVPTSGKEEEFSVGNYKSMLPNTDNQQISVTFYDMDEFNAPGFVIYFAASQGKLVRVNQNICGVESIAEALDKDGEKVALLNLWTNGTLTKVYTSRDSELIAECKALQKGDLIQYNTDASGSVIAIAKMFSYHSDTPVDPEQYKDGSDLAYRLNNSTAGYWTAVFKFEKAKKTETRDYVRLKTSTPDIVPAYQLGSFSANLSAFTVYDGEKFYKGNVDVIEEDDICVVAGQQGRIPRFVVLKGLELDDKYTDLYLAKK